MKVKYIGFEDELQYKFGGCHNPTGILEEGKEYLLYAKEVHSWHTKYFLEEIPDKWFNSILFEEMGD